MNEMNNLINQLSNGIENMNSYEMENYLVRLGVPRSEASAIAINKSTTSPAKANFVPFAQQNNVTPTAAAQFDLNIYRKTKALAFDLPVVLFSSIELASGYKKLITTPSGLTLVVTASPSATNPEIVEFSYTNGVDTDIVEVSCNGAAYTSLIEALKTDLIKMSKIRMRISDTSGSNTDQFTKPFTLINRSLFGTQKETPVSIGSFENPGDFKDNIVDVNGVLDIDKESGIRLYVRQSAGFTITLSAFVQHFRKHNAVGF
jgi:hypothetical protein